MRFEQRPSAKSPAPSTERQGASPQLGSLHLRLGCGEPLRACLSSRELVLPRTADTAGGARRLSAPWRPLPEWRR